MQYKQWSRTVRRVAWSCTGLAILLGSILHTSAQAPKKSVALFEFEKQALSKEWLALGPIQLARKTLPEVPAGIGTVPAGNGLEIRASPKSLVTTVAGQLPKNWHRYETLHFWIYRPPDEAKRTTASVMDVQLIEKDMRARFTRRVDLSHQGWQRIALPLAWFRTAGRVPRWDRIEHLMFSFRDQTHVWLDAVGLDEGSTERSSLLSAEDLRAVAFPGSKEGEVRVQQTDRVLLLTNAPDLEVAKLAAHLGNVFDAVYRDLPFLEKPVTPPCLIVFKTKEEYQAFTPRFVAKHTGVIAPPQAGGFTVLGVATSFWDPVQGTLRPVYVHEFVHSLLERALLLPNQSEWLHEGLANRFQLQFHPQKNLPEIVELMLKDEKRRSPLPVLCRGQGIALDHYVQAKTVVDTLISAEPYRKRFPELLAAFQKSASTNLEPHLGILGTDWAGLETAWREHCKTLK